MTSVVTRPAIALQDEIKKNTATKHPPLEEVLLSGNGSTTAFSLPAGLKPYAIYVDGVRKLSASITSITSTLNVYTITFAAAPASGTNNIQVDAVRV